MKTLKIAVMFFLGTILFVGCANDDSQTTSLESSAKVNTFLKSFYTKNYTFGTSATTKLPSNTDVMARSGEPASVEVENLIITEVFVGDEARARGYVVTDKITDEFKYFIDVDRVIHKMTNVKIDGNETIISTDIDDLPEYFSTDEFDFIKIASDLIANPTFVHVRFWGWTPWTNVGGCDDGFQTQKRTHRTLGIIDEVQYKEVRC